MLKPLREIAHQITWLKFAGWHLNAVRVRRTHPEGLVPPVPKRVIVEPTNACNLACAYCGNKDMLRPRSYIDLGLYERLLDEMVEHGIPRITLHTIGEPTLHPRIGELVKMATDRQRVVTLSTNGTLLAREDVSRALVRGGPHIINVSADAGDAETLAKTRDGLRPEVIVEGLKTIRRLRDEEGPIRDSPWGRVRLPTLTMTCVVTELFTRKIEREFFEVYAPYIDDFLFHFPNNHADYVPDRPYERGGILPRALRDRLYKAVRTPCYYPWDALFLLADGTMSVCRFDFDARVRIGRYGPQSLLELWHGDAMRSLRRAHMSFDFRDWSTCEKCTAMWYENRSEHKGMSRRLMKRNGVPFQRDAWLPENPMKTRMASEGAHAFWKLGQGNGKSA